MLTQERKRQKQLSRGALRKGCSKNMQHTYRRTPTLKHDLNKATSKLHETMPWQGCPCKSTVYLQNTPSTKHLWTAASEEREVLKIIYKKFYVKVYENLLE